MRSALLALVAGTVEPTIRPPSRAATRDLTPADPARERAVLERELAPVASRSVDDVEPERLQSAGARVASRLGARPLERRAPSVQRQDELVARDGRDIRVADLGAELIGRDLGDVERVADVESLPATSIPA